MNLKNIKAPAVFLVVATLSAALVAYLAYAYLQQREQKMKEEISAKAAKRVTPQIAVAVPRADTKEGTPLNLSNFVSRDIDADLVYPDTVKAKDFTQYEGQTLARPVLRGRPLQLSDLVAPEIKDVASTLPKGQRALTIDIDNLNSIAETLKPGNRVDLFLISKAAKPIGSELPDQAFEQVSLFMQNVQVIATGQEFRDAKKEDSSAENKMARPGEIQGAQKRGFDTVTILVDPKTAAKVLVGQKMGSYRAVLRPKDDADEVKMAMVRSGDFLPMQPQKPTGIEMIVGGKGGGSENLVSSLQRGVMPAGAAATLKNSANPDDVLKRLFEQSMKSNAGRTVSPTPPSAAPASPAPAR